MFCKWENYFSSFFFNFKIFLLLFRLILVSLLTTLTIHEAQSVTCQFTHDLSTFAYICELVDQVVENDSDLTIVSGEHLPGFRHEHVSVVITRNSRISIFPSLLFNHFPNVANANFESTNMTSFVRPLPNCRQMRFLNLNLNRLVNIPGGIFQDCMWTGTLSIQNSYVGTVSTNAFEGMTTLRFLDLSNNLISTLDGSSFKMLGHLRQLKLNNNSLRRFENGTFLGLNELEDFDLSFNQIIELVAGQFAPLRRMRTLNVGRNSIERIEREIFRVMPDLTLINLIGNVCADESVFLSIIPGHNIVPDLPQCFGSAGIKTVNALILVILVSISFVNKFKWIKRNSCWKLRISFNQHVEKTSKTLKKKLFLLNVVKIKFRCFNYIWKYNNRL